MTQSNFPCRLESSHGKMQSVCVAAPQLKTLDQAEKLKTPKEAKPLHDHFVPHSNKTSGPAEPTPKLPEIHEYDLGLKKNGEWVGIHVLEATSPKGAAFLKSNQEKLGLALIEREDGSRLFVPKGHSEGFRVISPKQQTLESNGSLERRQTENTVVYLAKNPAGQRFLKSHPELSS